MSATPPEGGAPRAAEDLSLPGGDFRLFVQKLGYQALISLGVVENPLTRSKDRNLSLAKGVIDDLAMLHEKTRGNLAEDEAEHLHAVIQNLRSHFTRLSAAPDADEGVRS